METQNLNFKQILKYVLIGIATFAVLALIFFGGIRYQKHVSSGAEKYLQEQIELAQKEADYWKNQYEDAAKGKETLLLKVDSLENRIKVLKKQYGQKVTIIKSYSNPELEQFFADRYGD